MIGHRTPRHEAFGWAAARLDDLVNLPASRLSAACSSSRPPLRRGRRLGGASGRARAMPRTIARPMRAGPRPPWRVRWACGSRARASTAKREVRGPLDGRRPSRSDGRRTSTRRLPSTAPPARSSSPSSPALTGCSSGSSRADRKKPLAVEMRSRDDPRAGRGCRRRALHRRHRLPGRRGA